MKRSPRDLLLERHVDAATQLNELRLSVVAGERPVPAREFLPALFRPHRRLWFGMAAAWVVILAFEFLQPARPPENARRLNYAARLHATSQAQLYALLATTSSLR